MKQPVQPEPLIVATSSPRRVELLREAGYQFEVVSPPIAEPSDLHPHVDPIGYAESLAFFKASSVACARPDCTILGADTIAVLNDEIIGKPRDRDDARRILRQFSGTTHRVITGVALMDETNDRRQLAHGVTLVHIRRISDGDIEAYLDTGAWEGKAGAYGIQDENDPFVERIEGSFTNVVGLPMELLARLFEHWVATTPHPA